MVIQGEKTMIRRVPIGRSYCAILSKDVSFGKKHLVTTSIENKALVSSRPFVNAFDDVLELKCRSKCLVLIGDVALGKITPIDGLNIIS